MDQTALGPREYSFVSRLVLGGLFVYAAALAVIAWMYPHRYQLSFEAYYYGAKAYNATGNPYDAALVREMAGKPHVFPYVKLPLTVHLYRPFTLLEFETAARVYLLLKLAAIAYLLWLWHAKFLRSGPDPVFLALCFLGFNFSMYWDLWSGNVNSFTDALLWTGLYAFTRGRLGRFTVLTVLASYWKLTPAFFLALLVFVPGRKGWAWLGAGIVMFTAMHGASFALYPDLTDDFMESAQKMRGLGNGDETDEALNQPGSASTLMAIRQGFDDLQRRAELPLPDATPFALYLAVAAGIFGLTIWAGRRYWPAHTDEQRLMLVIMTCFVYLLVTPRLLIYVYAIALLPAYLLVRRFPPVRPAYVLLALMIVAPVLGRPTGLNYVYERYADFYPLAVVYGLWIAGLWVMRYGRPPTERTGQVEERPRPNVERPAET